MNEFKDLIFLGEIVLQSKIAFRANERLEATKDNFDNLEVWCSIQSILVSVANVSKILWPTFKKYQERGERLRKTLNVEESNPLSNRIFRNHFEHYDSRIEDWFSNRSGGVYVDLVMNPSLNGRDFENFHHRGYNSFNDTLIFRGELLDLNEILNALEEIRNNCKGLVLDYP
ncbi:hypothetical protein ACI6PS_12655 [Flavobacterium sp. PLA-1-15]|uniref:hypothetical protein n=1 Tax=Flavobacterium sp. PLA-1-15 TaxID=3380533 RepID=UPI003B7ECBF4